MNEKSQKLDFKEEGEGSEVSGGGELREEKAAKRPLRSPHALVAKSARAAGSILDNPSPMPMGVGHILTKISKC